MQALLNEQVKRILLVRPAVEAGERLGFLLNVYRRKWIYRTLYDALYEMLKLDGEQSILNATLLKSRHWPLCAAAR